MSACNALPLIRFFLLRPTGPVIDPSIKGRIRRHIKKAVDALVKDPNDQLDRFHEGQLGHWLCTNDQDARNRAKHWIYELASQYASTRGMDTLLDSGQHILQDPDLDAMAFWYAPICIIDDWPYDAGAVLYTGESAQVFRFIFNHQDDARKYDKVRERLLECSGLDDVFTMDAEDGLQTEDRTEAERDPQRGPEYPSHRRIVESIPYVHIGGFIAGLPCLFSLAVQDVQSSIAADIVTRCLAIGSSCTVRGITPCAGGVLTPAPVLPSAGNMQADAYDPRPIDKDITSLPALSYEAIQRVFKTIPHGLRLAWRPSDQRLEEEQRLQKAKQFLLHAVRHDSLGEPYLALVLAVVGLEQLLAPPKDAPIGTTLALYAAILHEPERRECVYRQVLDAYRTRCHIVHQGNLKVDSNQAQEILQLVAATIVRADDRLRSLAQSSSEGRTLGGFILKQLMGTH